MHPEIHSSYRLSHECEKAVNNVRQPPGQDCSDVPPYDHYTLENVSNFAQLSLRILLHGLGKYDWLVS